MFRQFGKIFLVLAMILATAGPSVVLQMVAWTGMLAGNLATNSVANAVGKTFDGKHPCCLCKAIKAGKKSEKKPEISGRSLKCEFPPIKYAFVLFPPAPQQPPVAAGTFAEVLAVRPPTPPPRANPV